MLFGSSNGVHTLNYDIRILGRRGALVMTAVSDLELLPEVAEGCKVLLAVTEFNEGHAYKDFDPGMDKIAAYGIGGLIAGKLALKAGFFKVILIFLAKFWKIGAVAIVAIGAGIKNFLSRRKTASEPALQAEEHSEEEDPEA